MRHLTAETITTYIDGRALELERTAIDAHLTSCTECVELKQEFKHLMTRLEQDSLFEPPADTIVPKDDPSGLLQGLYLFWA